MLRGLLYFYYVYRLHKIQFEPIYWRLISLYSGLRRRIVWYDGSRISQDDDGTIFRIQKLINVGSCTKPEGRRPWVFLKAKTPSLKEPTRDAKGIKS
jgi:hypothetical protein